MNSNKSPLENKNAFIYNHYKHFYKFQAGFPKATYLLEPVSRVIYTA